MKGRSLALVALLVGGVLGVVASAQPWWRAVGEGVAADFTGTSVTAGLSQALSLVLLAGLLLLLVLRTRGRQVLGVLLVLTAAGMIAAGLARSRPSAEAIRTGVREVSLADQFDLVGTWWPTAYAVAGLVGLFGGLMLVLRARRWAETRRFDRPTAPAAATPAAVTDTAEPADLWRALDAGQDPTAVPGADPDVRPDDSGDTIGDQRIDDSPRSRPPRK